MQNIFDNNNCLITNNSKQANRWGVSAISAYCCAIVQNIVSGNITDNFLVVAESISDSIAYNDNLQYLVANEPQLQDYQVVLFKDYEFLPYDMLTANKDIISARIALYQNLIANQEKVIVICAITTLLNKIVPKQFIAANSFNLKVGQHINTSSIIVQLQQGGYQRLPIVTRHGQFATRGAVLDIFPTASQYPIRLEFFDRELESIRYFDPETQLTLRHIKAFTLLPAGEYDFEPAKVELFENQWLQHLPEAELDCQQLIAVKQMQLFPGIENYMPLFFENTNSLLDYFNDKTKVFIDKNCHRVAQDFIKSTKKRYTELNQQQNLLPPKLLFLGIEQIFADFKNLCRIEIDKNSKPVIAANKLKLNRQQLTRQIIELSLQKPTIISAQSQGQLQSLQNMLENNQRKFSIATNLDNALQQATIDNLIIIATPFAAGFHNEQIQLICFNEIWQSSATVQKVYESKAIQKQQQQATLDLMNIQVGDPIVHLQHGIGLYQGSKVLTDCYPVEEFIVISFQKGETLYTPINDLHLLSKFNIGSASQVPKLSRLGSSKWDSEVKKTKTLLEDSAGYLLASHQKRKLAKGIKMSVSQQQYQKFVAEFEYTETEDQLRAIADVEADMQAAKPMNRLVCGDVGFGKTEVALRAAFIAMNSDKQTVVLTPTTLLAKQHYDTFCSRFKNFDANIALVSSATDNSDIVAQMANNEIDIIIGTHKLLFSKLNFDNVGLLIIDEEHRFGVKQKQQLQQLNYQIDQLLLTATPIPRTLNIALSDLMDFSIITEPPQNRLPINTIVTGYNQAIIKEAILREVMRGGQVFFLQNQINKLETTMQELQQILPKVKFNIGHGQMPKPKLEKVMFEFYNHKFDVLICTTIIENGIDIANANTIVVDKAEQYGLAQLHQIRGRVGRSFHQAYAYLLIQNELNLTSDAKQRLQAIAAFTDLGSGFNIASSDLEIRGAGEILGKNQSGQIQKIGIALYLRLLQQAIDQKTGTNNDKQQVLEQISIKFGLSCLFTENYIPDVALRVSLYSELAAITSEDKLEAFNNEIIDRFGALTIEGRQLIERQLLKIKCHNFGIVEINCSDKYYRLMFSKTTCVQPETIIKILQDSPAAFKFTEGNCLAFAGNTKFATEDLDTRISALSEVEMAVIFASK